MESFAQNSPNFSGQDSPIFPVSPNTRYATNFRDQEVLKEKERKIKKNKKPKKKKQKQFEQGQCSQEELIDPNSIIYLMTNSDIKNHIVVKKISHLVKQRKQYVENVLKHQIQEKFGKIETFKKIYVNCEQIWLIGFEKDTFAYQFLTSSQGLYKIKFEDQTSIALTIEPTEVFNRFWNSMHQFVIAHKIAPKIQWKEINQYEKSNKNKFIIQQNYEQNQRMPQGNNKSQEQKKQFKTEERKPFFRQLKNPKSLIIWGIPLEASKRGVVPEMKKISINVRNIGNSKWIRVANSYCQILQIQVESNYFDQVHQQLTHFKINDQTCLVTQAPNSHSQIYDVLSKYQVKLVFSNLLNPSVIYRALDNISPIVDMCIAKQSNSNDDDKCNVFYVTFTRKQAVQQLLQIGNKIEGLSILPVDKCIYIYRRIHKYERVSYGLQGSQQSYNITSTVQNTNYQQKIEQKAATYQNYEAKDDIDY